MNNAFDVYEGDLWKQDLFNYNKIFDLYSKYLINYDLFKYSVKILNEDIISDTDVVYLNKKRINELLNKICPYYIIHNL